MDYRVDYYDEVNFMYLLKPVARVSLRVKNRSETFQWNVRFLDN